MAVTLIVEDGNIVANANSYVDLVFAKQYASDMGLTLPTTDDAIASGLLNANRFIEGLESRFQGHRVSAAQALAWPRAGVMIGGNLFPQNAIPGVLKNAQVIAASMINNGVDFFATQSGQFITKEKVDVIETEYSAEFLATADGKPYYTAIESMLNSLFIQNGGYRLTSRIGF